MTRQTTDAADTTRGQPLVALFVLVVAVVLVVALVRSALEAPSGEGVPGPPQWARHERSQAGP